MKNLVIIFIVFVFIQLSSCKKMETNEPSKLKQSKEVIGLNDERVNKFVQSSIMKKYLSEKGLMLSEEVVLTKSGNKSIIGMKLKGASRAEQLDSYIVVFEEQSSRVFSPFIVTEKLYFGSKIGYEVSSLLTPEIIDKEFKYYKVGEDIVPDARDCGNNMSYIDCVWNCFNWLGDQGSGWGIGCTLLSSYCMGAAAMACMLSIEHSGNDPISFSEIQGNLNQKKIQGFISDYVIENNTFIVK